jgi:hypothetical protein
MEGIVMAEQNSTTKETERQELEQEWLSDLLSRALWPLQGFVKFFEERQQEDEMLMFLKPLVELAGSNLEKVETVLERSFGRIKIETLPSFQLFGSFKSEYLVRAYVWKPTEKPAQEGGE